MDNSWIPTSEPWCSKNREQHNVRSMDESVGCSGASMTNAAHTPGLLREAHRRTVRRFASTQHSPRVISSPINQQLLTCSRWNRCSVRIVRVRTRSGTSVLERGNRASPKPGSRHLTASTGEHAQGWCHGSSIRFFRRTPQLGRSFLSGRTPCPSRTGRHVRRRVSRAVRTGTPHAPGAGRHRAASAPLSWPWRPAPPLWARRGRDGARPARRCSCPACLTGAGRASPAHDRAGPARLARRESLFDHFRNRTGGFTP